MRVRAGAFLFGLLCLVLSVLLSVAAESAPKDTFDENAKDSFYDWFGLSRKSFDKEELTTKYRKLARQYHPDKNKEEGAAEIFYKITKAFDVLNDDEKRALYNRGGIKAVDGGAGEGQQQQQQYAHDIFRRMFNMDDIFGGGGGGPARGPSGQAEMEVTLEDMFTGKAIEFTFSRTKICGHCQGSGGQKAGDVKKCTRCGGAGAIIIQKSLGPGFVQRFQMACDVCHGKGSIVKEVCTTCMGERVVREVERLTVTVERGSKDGEQVIFEGMADETPGRETGDLIIILKTSEHDTYQRDGINLYVDVDLSLRQALFGFRINVPQLDGKAFFVERTEVTQNGHVDRLPNGGMPRKAMSKRGDLFVKYRVILPPTLTDKQRELLAKALPAHDVAHDEEL